MVSEVVSQKLSHLQAMPRITKRSVKPTPEPTVTESDVTIMEAPEHVESDSSSGTSVALPIPSKASSRRPSREPEPSSSEESGPESEPDLSESEAEPPTNLKMKLPPELQVRIDYIHHLIETEDEEMLERMLNLLQSWPISFEEQLGLIRSALAELNRRYVAECQHEWVEERAALAAAERAAKEAAERAIIEAEERRLRECELAQLAELQAKYKSSQGTLPMYLGIVALLLSLIVLFSSK